MPTLESWNQLTPRARPRSWFNSLQSAMLDLTWSSDASLAVSAPTGAGKTVLFELAILRMLQSAGSVDAAGRFLRRPASVKAVYIAPMRAIVQERLDDWSRRFGSLGLKCMEVTGDSNVSVSDLREVDIVLTTPEKFDSVTRKNSDRGSMAFFADIALLMIDEVHTLGDDRGPALEAVVCRLKSLSRLPSLQGTPLARMRCLAVSATIPNVRDVGAWLGAPPQGCASFGDEYRATPLDITVHGYNASSNDYLFERNLKYYLFPIAARYSEGKPVLVFCASRKGAEEAAAKLAEDVPPGAVRARAAVRFALQAVLSLHIPAHIRTLGRACAMGHLTLGSAQPQPPPSWPPPLQQWRRPPWAHACAAAWATTAQGCPPATAPRWRRSFGQALFPCCAPPARWLRG